MKQSNARIEEEMGDVLFSVINLCRHVNIDADVALQKANSKFERRFRLVETLVLEQDKQMADLDEAQLDLYWVQAKKILRET